MREDKSVQRLMTVNDVAERVGVARLTIRRWIADGTLPTINLNDGRYQPNGTPMQRCIRIWPDDLEKFIQERREQRTNRGGRR